MDDVSASLAQSELTKNLMQEKLKSIVPDVTFKFWDRLLATIRATLLLIQSGFIGEALALQRLSIEHFACAVALLHGKLTKEQLVKQMEVELADQGQKIQQLDKQYPTLAAEKRRQLAGFVEEAEAHDAKKPGLNPYNALGSCGLGFVYTNYRRLSILAAHSTLLGAIRQPTDKDVEELLTFARELLSILGATATKVARQED